MEICYEYTHSRKSPKGTKVVGGDSLVLQTRGQFGVRFDRETLVLVVLCYNIASPVYINVHRICWMVFVIYDVYVYTVMRDFGSALWIIFVRLYVRCGGKGINEIQLFTEVLHIKTCTILSLCAT